MTIHMLAQENMARKLHSRVATRRAQLRAFENTRKIASGVNTLVGNQMYEDVIKPMADDQWLDRKMLKILQRNNAAGILL